MVENGRLSVCCAVVAGSTTRGTCVRLTVIATILITAITTSACGWPEVNSPGSGKRKKKQDKYSQQAGPDRRSGAESVKPGGVRGYLLFPCSYVGMLIKVHCMHQKTVNYSMLGLSIRFMVRTTHPTNTGSRNFNIIDSRSHAPAWECRFGVGIEARSQAWPAISKAGVNSCLEA